MLSVSTHAAALPTGSRVQRGTTVYREFPEPRSAAGRRALEQIRRFARDRTAPVLLEGETGTGKTAIARELHRASPRASGPFEHVVLSALDDALASSDLFGHVAGAFTDARHTRIGYFASAHKGTLFLDEIGKASPTVQRRLLHAMEYGEIRPMGADRDVKVDVRIVAATSISLATLVERDEFLLDLFARLCGFRVCLPALRERRIDIPDLATWFAQLYAASSGYSETPELAADLLEALANADWPYNLRQLAATVHRLIIEADGARVVTLDHCRDDLEYLRLGSRDVEVTAADIARALSSTRNNKTKAAAILGMDRTTLHRRLRALKTGGISTTNEEQRRGGTPGVSASE